MIPDFVILRYFVSCPFVDDVAVAKYEQYFGPDSRRNRHMAPDSRNKILTPIEAKRLIRLYAMHNVVDNQHGQVWEKKN